VEWKYHAAILDAEVLLQAPLESSGGVKARRRSTIVEIGGILFAF
jgi:hypothetical protein